MLMVKKKIQDDYSRKFVFLVVFIVLIALAYFVGVSREQSKQLKLHDDEDQKNTQLLDKQIKALRDEFDNTKSLKTSN